MRTPITLLFLLLFTTFALAKDLHTVTFKVEQMTCVNCEAKVKREVPYFKGVKKMKTQLDIRTVTITFDAEKTSIEQIQKGFDKFGYKAELIEQKSENKKKE